jgi:hypothetical protein
MQLRRFDNVREFYDHVQDYLLQHEAEGSLYKLVEVAN